MTLQRKKNELEHETPTPVQINFNMKHDTPHIYFNVKPLPLACKANLPRLRCMQKRSTTPSQIQIHFNMNTPSKPTQTSSQIHCTMKHETHFHLQGEPAKTAVHAEEVYPHPELHPACLEEGQEG
jgi:hypothetical protein